VYQCRAALSSEKEWKSRVQRASSSILLKHFVPLVQSFEKVPQLEAMARVKEVPTPVKQVKAATPGPHKR
jgi:hypothetical protein